MPLPHRVYFPGPHSTTSARVLGHGDADCSRICPIADKLADITTPEVQGDYFTYDGVDFIRCAWQPLRSP